MMISKKFFVSVAFAVATVAVAMTGVASAQGLVSDQRTYFTFSAPVQLPGVTLPAGKYTFRLMDSQTNRHVVQIFNADGTKILATIMAIPAQRNDFTEKAEIQFLETPMNVPAAVDVWWYPGTKTGHEFTYPKATSDKWAKAKSGSAKMVMGEPAPATMNFVPSVPSEVEKATQPPIAETPAPSTSAPPVAASVRSDTATSMSDSSAPRGRLPHTASSLPLMAGLGFVMLFGGMTLAVARRRRVV